MVCSATHQRRRGVSMVAIRVGISLAMAVGICLAMGWVITLVIDMLRAC